MTDLLKTALLLEEKASRLERSNPRRAELLAYAKAFRLLNEEMQTPDYEIEHSIGSFAKRAQVWTQMAMSMSDADPQKRELLRKAERARVHNALEQLNPLPLDDMKVA